MSRIRWYGPSLMLLAATVLVMVTGADVARELVYAQTDQRAKLIQNRLADNPTLQQLSRSFRDVAKAVSPSVVYVSIGSRSSGGKGMSEGQLEQLPEPFRRFFEQRQPDRGGRREGGERYRKYDPVPQIGNGSGWIYDEQGHIITNNHVVKDADEITVRFQDGSEQTAEVVGTDPRTDVAVLKVDPPVPHPARVARNPVHQGEMVFAFGSPFRFDFSMSQGIVSATDRELNIIKGQAGQAGYEDFIQTDAAINPGNSGGPLTNVRGEVVGMNTAIASRTGSYNGLGFATPVAMITNVADQLIKQGSVSRGYLGVYIQDAEGPLAKSFGYEGKGVLVQRVVDGSPAEQAGLQRGDIITSLNGDKVAAADQLRLAVSQMRPEAQVRMKIFREGERQNVNVTLGNLSKSSIARGSTSNSRGMDQGTDQHGTAQQQTTQALERLGIQGLQPLNQRLAQRLDIPQQSGVIITSVRSQSTVAAKGITSGTVITEVMNQKIEDVDQLLSAMKGVEPGQPLRLRVLQPNPRTGEMIDRFVAFNIPDQR